MRVAGGGVTARKRWRVRQLGVHFPVSPLARAVGRRRTILVQVPTSQRD